MQNNISGIMALLCKIQEPDLVLGEFGVKWVQLALLYFVKLKREIE